MREGGLSIGSFSFLYISVRIEIVRISCSFVIEEELGFGFDRLLRIEM